jgi:diguanylate cyclase (GGDEF)-like protein
MSVVGVALRSLDEVLPLHILFDPAGRIVHAGSTMRKIAPGLIGRSTSQAFSVVRPRLPADAPSLLGAGGRRITIALRPTGPGSPGVAADGGGDGQRLRATVVPVDGGGGLIVAAFGADISETVSRHSLSAADFGPTDQSVELLYVLEAQAAVSEQADNLISRLAAARDVAKAEAQTDTLTGLRNRRSIEVTLERLVGAAGTEFGLMHLDLDHFKEVNDRLGHLAGDHVLVQVARILQDEVRRDDLVARLGGDEFLLVFEECAELDQLEAIARRVIRRIESPIVWQGESCRVSASIGITTSALYERPEAVRMIADADKALYRSKRGGRARCARALRTAGSAP